MQHHAASRDTRWDEMKMHIKLVFGKTIRFPYNRRSDGRPSVFFDVHSTTELGNQQAHYSHLYDTIQIKALTKCAFNNRAGQSVGTSHNHLNDTIRIKL